MIGGEHKKERFSERIERCENQPRNRGYLPGTAPKSAGYTSSTLQGNWSEERADASYYDGKPALPTANERYYRTNYQFMTSDVAQAARMPPKEEFDQATMIEIVNHTQSSFPGHQLHVDRTRGETLRGAHMTTSRQTFRPPAEAASDEKAYVPPVLGGVPGAQATGVTMRLRHQLASGMPGRSAFPGNVARTVRHALQDACTDASGSGRVNTQELQKGLAAVGVTATEPECVALIRWFDKVGDGCAPVADIANALRGQLSDRRAQLTQSVYQLLVSLSPDGIVRLDAIAALIDVAQLERVRAGEVSEEQAREAFVEQWDARKADAYISPEAFAAYFADASFEVETDGAFELAMRNMWHLSGGNGKCANTSCRRVEIIHNNGRITQQEIKNDLAIKGDGPEAEEAMRQNLAKQGIKDIKRMRVL